MVSYQHPRSFYVLTNVLYLHVQYWVSQGKKWCDYCKIYIANNTTSLRNHEFGQRHKESVAQRLANMRKDGLAKEKEKQHAIKDLERIEIVCIIQRVSLSTVSCLYMNSVEIPV